MGLVDDKAIEDPEDFRILQDSYFRVATLYSQWFSWCFFLFLAAEGYVVTSSAGKMIEPWVLTAKFLVFLFFSLVAITIAVYFSKYSVAVEKICAARYGPATGPLMLGGVYFKAVRLTGIVALSGTIVLNSLICIYLERAEPGPGPRPVAGALAH